MSIASTTYQTGVVAAPLARDGLSMPMPEKEGVALLTEAGCSTLQQMLKPAALWEPRFLQTLKLTLVYAAWFLTFSPSKSPELKPAVAQLVYNTWQMRRQVLRDAVHQRKLWALTGLLIKLDVVILAKFSWWMELLEKEAAVLQGRPTPWIPLLDKVDAVCVLPFPVLESKMYFVPPYSATNLLPITGAPGSVFKVDSTTGSGGCCAATHDFSCDCSCK